MVVAVKHFLLVLVADHTCIRLAGWLKRYTISLDSILPTRCSCDVPWPRPHYEPLCGLHMVLVSKLSQLIHRIRNKSMFPHLSIFFFFLEMVALQNGNHRMQHFILSNVEAFFHTFGLAMGHRKIVRLQRTGDVDRGA